QGSVNAMLQQSADLGIVVGGYNSSNTSHLVELCEEKLPTYFINSAEKIISDNEILHFNFHTKEELKKENWLPAKKPVKILLTSGASCPDALVEGVINKLASLYNAKYDIETLLNKV
ncbi:MAG TPA: 4-hydroxy-3-methylbut-2-enyl diphosphate reductase, partial [Chitinophagaceae bacterium]|nr:4-hydroxy-3-methylbut-2-enyl diphosphate reductase [Chitinophagaceae bacterium]